MRANLQGLYFSNMYFRKLWNSKGAATVPYPWRPNMVQVIGSKPSSDNAAQGSSEMIGVAFHSGRLWRLTHSLTGNFGARGSPVNKPNKSGKKNCKRKEGKQQQCCEDLGRPYRHTKDKVTFGRVSLRLSEKSWSLFETWNQMLYTLLMARMFCFLPASSPSYAFWFTNCCPASSPRASWIANF